MPNERDVSVITSNKRDESPVIDSSIVTQPVINQGELQVNLDPKVLELIQKAERGELKAKLSIALDRGFLYDRLKVDLPSDLYGEWVLNNVNEIRRKEGLGYRLDNEYSTSRALHDDGTSSTVIGDVVFMIVDKSRHEVIKEILMEQHLERNMPKKGVGNKEEQDLINVVRKQSGGDIPISIESVEKRADYAAIKEALGVLNNQTVPNPIPQTSK